MIAFQFNKAYSFNTLAPVILGARMENLTYTGTVGYEVACTFDNIMQKHRSVYPELPVGTLDQPSKYAYHLFKSKRTNESIILADCWIDATSIIEFNKLNLSATIANITNDDVEKIRGLLFLNGYREFTLQIL